MRHKPIVGRMVHYINQGPVQADYTEHTQAALITVIMDNGKICATVFYPTGIIHLDSVPYSDEYKPGHWSFPPKG